LASLEHLQNGRYAVLKKLGEGGKGIVFKARDTALNRVVAIKMLKNPVTTGEAYTRFITEAQSVAKLNHPNIVSIYDIGKEDEKPFFVLEFVEGHDLRDLIETSLEGKCDIQTVLRIGVDVCNALQYAHSQGILHRDIKPENIKVAPEGVAKLMDFGLARMLGQPRQTQDGVIVGTVAYVAPEIALGKGADARSDLYSLGAVLYEAVTGKPPFPGEDPVKVIFSHIHDHPVSPDRLNPKLPHALAECIMKLLEKDPTERYQSAADLLRVLRDIAEEPLKKAMPSGQRPILVAPGARSVGRREIQLIDRVEEMNRLREAVDGAVRGEGGLLFLRGEAGIGKTRLTRELGAYARLRGMNVLYGRCPSLLTMTGIPPYNLWSEVIRDYLQASTAEQLYRVIGFYPSEVSKLVPDLRQRLGAFPQSLPLDPEHERDRLFEAVSQFITNVSKEAPLLVVLDDLQWTDQSSLLLMHYLARGLSRERLLLVGAYRDNEVDEKHPLWAVLAELNRARLLQAVSLKRMSLNDVSEMIKQILEQDDVPKEFCQLVYRKTDGNPFYVEEVIKSLTEEGLIYLEENHWKVKEISTIEFPETVRGVVKARIGRLDDECRNLLTMASFVGYDFTFEALRAVTGLEENKLVELLERMLKTGQIKERVIRGEDAYSFADAIVRDVVHEEVSRLMHRRLHNVAAIALEKVYASKIDDHLAELAYQFLEGNDRDQALDYFLKAGEKAWKVYANNEAASYFQSAFQLLDEKEGELDEKARVFERLGDIKRIQGEYNACVEHWDRALELWKKLDEKENVSRIHRRMASVLDSAMGEKGKAETHYQEALKILEAMPETVELASLYQYRASMFLNRGDLPSARSLGTKALELAEKLNAQEVVADSCDILGQVFEAIGDAQTLRKAIEYYERGLKTALDSGYLERAIWCYDRLGVITTFTSARALHERGSEYFEKGYALAKKVGHIHQESWLSSQLAFLMLLRGEVGNGVSLAEASLALARKAAHMEGICWSLNVLGYAYLIQDEWERSEQCLGEALTISQKLSYFEQNLFSNYGLGLLYLEKGECAKAVEFSERFFTRLEKAGSLAYPTIFSWLVLPYIELGKIGKAEKQIGIYHKLAVETEDKQLIAILDTLRAASLRAQKKWDESIKLFERSLQEWAALGVRMWLVHFFAMHVLFECARVYLERDQEGDRGRAHSLLNQALEIFQKIGAKKNIERVIAKKKLLTA